MVTWGVAKIAAAIGRYLFTKDIREKPVFDCALFQENLPKGLALVAWKGRAEHLMHRPEMRPLGQAVVERQVDQPSANFLALFIPPCLLLNPSLNKLRIVNAFVHPSIVPETKLSARISVVSV